MSLLLRTTFGNISTMTSNLQFSSPRAPLTLHTEGAFAKQHRGHMNVGNDRSLLQRFFWSFFELFVVLGFAGFHHDLLKLHQSRELSFFDFR